MEDLFNDGKIKLNDQSEDFFNDGKTKWNNQSEDLFNDGKTNWNDQSEDLFKDGKTKLSNDSDQNGEGQKQNGSALWPATRKTSDNQVNKRIKGTMKQGLYFPILEQLDLREAVDVAFESHLVSRISSFWNGYLNSSNNWSAYG